MFEVTPSCPLIFSLWRVYQNKRQSMKGFVFAYFTNKMENILWEVWYFDTITGFAKLTVLKAFYESLNSSLKLISFLHFFFQICQWALILSGFLMFMFSAALFSVVFVFHFLCLICSLVWRVLPAPRQLGSERCCWRRKGFHVPSEILAVCSPPSRFLVRASGAEVRASVLSCQHRRAH